MSVAVAELEQYAGQKVVLVYTPSGENEATEVEGTAEAANQMGVLLKPKGRQNMELIEVAQIEDIRFAPEKAKDLKAQELQLVKYGSARKHVLDRHGVTLAEANAMSEEDALSTHAEIDHTGLGHVHVEKKKDEKKDEASSE